MPTDWNNLTAFARQAFIQRFVSQAMAEDWLEQLPTISLRQLHLHALNADAPDRKTILQRLKQDALTQKRYAEVLRNINAKEMTHSTKVGTQGQITEGRSPHWQYHLEAASPSLNEAYLTVEISPGFHAPSRLFARSIRCGLGAEAPLQKVHNGVIHMVLPSTDSLFKILSQPDREVWMW